MVLYIVSNIYASQDALENLEKPETKRLMRAIKHFKLEKTPLYGDVFFTDQKLAEDSARQKISDCKTKFPIIFVSQEKLNLYCYLPNGSKPMALYSIPKFKRHLKKYGRDYILTKLDELQDATEGLKGYPALITVIHKMIKLKPKKGNELPVETLSPDELITLISVTDGAKHLNDVIRGDGTESTDQMKQQLIQDFKALGDTLKGAPSIFIQALGCVVVGVAVAVATTMGWPLLFAVGIGTAGALMGVGIFTCGMRRKGLSKSVVELAEAEHRITLLI